MDEGKVKAGKVEEDKPTILTNLISWNYVTNSMWLLDKSELNIDTNGYCLYFDVNGNCKLKVSIDNLKHIKMQNGSALAVQL